MCSPLEQAGKERERVKEREKGEPYTRIPDSRRLQSLDLTEAERQLYRRGDWCERCRGGSMP